VVIATEQIHLAGVNVISMPDDDRVSEAEGFAHQLWDSVDIPEDLILDTAEPGVYLTTARYSLSGEIDSLTTNQLPRGK
jgi:hypothetical protein